MVHVERIARQGLEALIVCWRESARRVIIARQPGRPCLAHSNKNNENVEDVVLSLGGQTKNAPISSWDFARNWHSLFRCAEE